MHLHYLMASPRFVPKKNDTKTQSKQIYPMVPVVFLPPLGGLVISSQVFCSAPKVSFSVSSMSLGEGEGAHSRLMIYRT